MYKSKYTIYRRKVEGASTLDPGTVVVGAGLQMPTFRPALPNRGSSGGCCSPTRRLRAALALGQGASAPLLYIVSNFCFSRWTALCGIKKARVSNFPGSQLRLPSSLCPPPAGGTPFCFHPSQKGGKGYPDTITRVSAFDEQTKIRFDLLHLPALYLASQNSIKRKEFVYGWARKKPEFPRASQLRLVGIMDLHTVKGPTSRARGPGSKDYSGVSLALHDQLVPNIGCRSGCRVRWLPQRYQIEIICRE